MEAQAREVAVPMVPTSIAAATQDEEVKHGHSRHRHQQEEPQERSLRNHAIRQQQMGKQTSEEERA